VTRGAPEVIRPIALWADAVKPEYKFRWDKVQRGRRTIPLCLLRAGVRSYEAVCYDRLRK